MHSFCLRNNKPTIIIIIIIWILKTICLIFFNHSLHSLRYVPFSSSLLYASSLTKQNYNRFTSRFFTAIRVLSNAKMFTRSRRFPSSSSSSDKNSDNSVSNKKVINAVNKTRLTKKRPALAEVTNNKNASLVKTSVGAPSKPMVLYCYNYLLLLLDLSLLMMISLVLNPSDFVKG